MSCSHQLDSELLRRIGKENRKLFRESTQVCLTQVASLADFFYISKRIRIILERCRTFPLIILSRPETLQNFFQSLKTPFSCKQFLRRQNLLLRKHFKQMNGLRRCGTYKQWNLLSHSKEQNNAMCINKDGTRDSYTK